MPTLGKYVEAMDDENNLLYPKTVAAQVIYSAGQMLPGKIAELEGNIRNVDQKVDNVKNEVDNAKNDNNQIYPTLKGRLDAMDTRTKTNTDEISNARDRKGVVHPNLKARLDAMDTDCDTIKIEVEQARGGEISLGDRITNLANGNQVTLDEVIKARNGEVDLDTRLDKMQDTITETSNRVTQAMTDDLGVTHPTLQVRLDRMRQSAARTDEEVINARTSPNFPNAPYANLKARLDAMDVGTNEIKKEISDARGAGNNTLNERLDKMQDQINAGGGGGGGATIQEVVDARTDNVSTPNVIHNSLGDRLDSMQTVINNHLALPHITYREILPYHAVITTHDEIAIVTDDGKGIEKTGNVTKAKATTKAAPTNSIKITQLANKKPTNDDLLVIETAQGTASTKVSDLPFNIKYTIV